MSFARITDTATPRLNWLMGRLNSSGQQRFLLNWAVAVRKEAIRRCLAKGGRRFWREMARSVQVERGSGSMLVEAQHRAAAQKQYGGVIKAKGKAGGGADHLAIPIEGSEAEGKDTHKFALGGYELFALGLKDDNQGVLGYTGKDGQFVPLFVLVTKTKPQRPDKFMPEDSDVTEYGIEEALHILSR